MRRGKRYPVIISILVHLVITPLLWHLASVATPPEQLPGEFRADVVAEAPLVDEIEPPAPPPEEPTRDLEPVKLDEEEPPEPVLFAEVEPQPTPKPTTTIAFSLPSRRSISLKPIVSRRRPEPVVARAATPVRPAVRRPAGPTRKAFPNAGNPAPRYPRVATKRGIEGVVLLCVEVSPKGSVVEVKVHQSSGHGFLDRAAISAVRDWSFRPALRAGVPIPSVIEVPIRFQLRG